MNILPWRALLLVVATGSLAARAAAQEGNPTARPASPNAVESASPSATAGHLVDSLSALQEKIKTAQAGDRIVLKNGVYTTAAAINVACAGTSEQPITITAESVGGAEIAGTNGIKVQESAAHVVIAGFKFTHASGQISVAEGARFVRFTRNSFQCTGDGHYVAIIGSDVQVDYNDFGPKKFPGTMIAVSGAGSQVARRLWVHHNHFHDFDNDGSNGAEMIRVGLLSSHRLSKGDAIVEHNLFERCRGLNDFISNRSSGNIYRYNTFLDSRSSHLTVRQGDDCAIYGNIFRQTEGVRLYGDRHLVFSNYFEGNYIGVAIGNGSIEISEAGNDVPANSHDRPDGCVIAFNTFVDNNTHYQMSRRTNGLGATNTTFAHNLLQGGGPAAKIDGPNTGAIWQGNLLWKISAARDLPDSGYTTADPLLAPDSGGITRPQAGSPAIAAAPNMPSVTVELDGGSRPERTTIGADEPGTERAIAKLLTPADVGPAAPPNTAVADAGR
jgi:poly(beta-D-mannuronate) lyase